MLFIGIGIPISPTTTSRISPVGFTPLSTAFTTPLLNTIGLLHITTNTYAKTFASLPDALTRCERLNPNLNKLGVVKFLVSLFFNL